LPTTEAIVMVGEECGQNPAMHSTELPHSGVAHSGLRLTYFLACCLCVVFVPVRKAITCNSNSRFLHLKTSVAETNTRSDPLTNLTLAVLKQPFNFTASFRTPVLLSSFSLFVLLAVVLFPSHPLRWASASVSQLCCCGSTRRQQKQQVQAVL